MATLAYIAPLTLVAYILFFLYDWRMVNRSNNATHAGLFIGGCLLVLTATIVLLTTQLPQAHQDAIFFLFILFALVSAALMIKALFFSLPADTYTTTEQVRHTYTKGMYALCRHPGVLWYCLMYAAVAVALRTPVAFIGCCLLCAGNLAYMIFQDKWSFPRIFCDYTAYQKSTPVFFPTPASFSTALNTCAKVSE